MTASTPSLPSPVQSLHHAISWMVSPATVPALLDAAGTEPWRQPCHGILREGILQKPPGRLGASNRCVPRQTAASHGLM